MTIYDRVFLNHCGIDAGPLPCDGTAELLRELNLPQTWANWLMLSTAGHPELAEDGEIEAVVDDAINNAPSSGECGEPDYENADADENDEDDE